MKGIIKKWLLFLLMLTVIKIGDKISLYLFSSPLNSFDENLILSWVAFYITLKTLEEKK